jgi:hypothetical protein
VFLGLPKLGLGLPKLGLGRCKNEKQYDKEENSLFWRDSCFGKELLLNLSMMNSKTPAG